MTRYYLIFVLMPLLVYAGKSDWYKNAVFYQVYPRSFRDSNNDGTGDIQGVYEKLDYLKYTGITVVWMSPIFMSPQVDHGYDISDYYAIDPQYGSWEDLIRLLGKAKQLGIKIVLDLVPNHTSEVHQWFKNSVNEVEGYEDFYVWVDGRIDKDGKRVAPNNWLSVFSKTAWTWNEQRQKYYLHQFDPSQPDLNLRNPKVVTELKRVLSFYFDLGVDGFRIDAAPHFIEDPELRDEPLLPDANDDPNRWDNLDHIYTKDVNETYEFIYDLRSYVDDYNSKHDGDDRIIFTEAYTFFDKTLLYFGDNDAIRLGAHFTFNFEIVLYHGSITADDIKEIVERWIRELNKNYCLNWSLGNHDNHRIASRLGNVDGFNMLILFLPGIAATYYGEEIGQENGEVACAEGTDPKAIHNCTTYPSISRDYERTPFQWDSTINAGFNSGFKPWLPVSRKYKAINLAAQITPGLRSHYNIYRNMIKLREKLKDCDEIIIDDGARQNVLVITRWNSSMKNGSYIFLFNLENERSKEIFLKHGSYRVLVSSVNSQYKDRQKFIKNSILLLPQESLLLKKIQSEE